MSARPPLLPRPSSPWINYDRRLMIVSGSTCEGLAAEVAQRFSLRLTPTRLVWESVGTVRCSIEQSIRGADIFIIQSLVGNRRRGVSVSDALAELLSLVDAARAASARRVFVVIPASAYAAHDRQTAPRLALPMRWIARAVQAAGADRLVLLDPPRNEILGFLPATSELVSALPILASYFNDAGAERLVTAAVVGRDLPWAHEFRRRTHTEFAVLHFEDHEVRNVGDVRERSVVVITHTISTGMSSASAVRALRDLGAARVSVCAVHGPFAAGALERLADAGVNDLVTTDSVEAPAAPPPWMQVVPTAEVLSSALQRVFMDRLP